MGISEIIVILLSLGGFGVTPDPAAPAAAEVLRYAPDDAEGFVYLDVAATVPRNWQVLEKLPQAPAVKSSREATRAVSDLLAKVRALRDQARTAAGFDPVTDVKTAACFATFHGGQDPDFLVVLRGSFPPTLVDHALGQVGGTRSVIGGQAMLTSPDGKMALALAADGTLLGGTTLWVKERLFGFAPRRSALGDVAAPGLDTRPFFYATMRLSPATLLYASRSVHDPIATDFFGGLADLSVGFHANGVSASFATRTATGFARGLLAANGAIAILRAGHQYLRGFIYLFAAVVDSMAKSDAIWAGLAAHKTELLGFLEAATGDGNFQATIDKKDAQHRADIRLTGKTIGDVMPMAGIFAPLMLAVYLSAGVPPTH